MPTPRSTSARVPDANEDFERFRQVKHLGNHWTRPAGANSYYWYATFDRDAEIQALARRCQQAIDLPYYDMTPPADLHMTIERIAVNHGRVQRRELDAVVRAVEELCQAIPPHHIAVGHLAGTPGALGFSVYPQGLLRSLQDSIRTATLQAHPGADVHPATFQPHIAIGYWNTAGNAAADAVAAVEPLTDSAFATTTITDTSLVRLTRGERSYQWEEIRRVPLLAAPDPDERPKGP